MAFCAKFDGIERELVIKNAGIIYNEKIERAVAQFDTGCNKTNIDLKLIERLNLQSVGDGFMATLSDREIPVKLYEISLLLPGKINIPKLQVIGKDLFNIDILIGMDVISKGDFFISSYGGRTTVVFNVPPIKEFHYMHNQ